MQAVFLATLIIQNFLSTSALPTPSTSPPPCKPRGASFLRGELSRLIDIGHSEMPDDTFWSNFTEIPHGDKTCPSHQTTSDNIMDRSTCPWYFVERLNHLMYPRQITDINCRCERCMGASNGANDCVQVKGDDFVPILWQSNVTDEAGYCEYKLYNYPKSHGCTCIFPFTTEAS